jgi:hypothetical protein
MKFTEIEAICTTNGLVDTWPESISLYDVLYENPFGITLVEDEDDYMFLFPDGVKIDGLKFFWDEPVDFGTYKLFTVFGNKESDRWVGFFSPAESPDAFQFFQTTDELLAIIKSL